MPARKTQVTNGDRHANVTPARTVYRDPSLKTTDLARWRLKTSGGSHGRHTWHYLPDDPKVLKEWPQTEEDRYWLGLETVRAANHYFTNLI